MDVYPVGSSRTHLPISNLPRLIETAGTSKFERLFFAASKDVLQCEHLNVLAFTNTGLARSVIAESAGTRPVARMIASLYIDRYRSLDPAVRLSAKSLGNQQIQLLRTAPNDIHDSEYRENCYTAARLVERLSLIRRSGNETIRLSFYATRRFQDNKVSSLANASGVMMSLLSRHLELRSKYEGESEIDFARKRFQRLEPGISGREADICAGIVVGMNTEAISLNLNIAQNTVLTYRKRAYSKLGISTQNQLMRLAYC
jgi:DNA-binding CsgD family transcriptional regulator